jgi:2-polyprenyl-3-methyl-5-hydroxy-6-metoxy-1,4-benzoquinol methylase
MSIDYKKRLYGSYVQSHLSAVELKNRVILRAPYMRALINNHFPANRDARILDLGCGYGALIYHALSLGYTHMNGVDVSPEQVAGAKQLGIPGVTEGDLFDTLKDTPDNSLDTVITIDVIEHLDKDELLDFADEVFRVLDRGGIWISHQPNALSPFFGRVRYGDLTHQLAFTSESIRQLILAIGFANVRCHEDIPAVHGVKSLVRRLFWSFVRTGFRICLSIESGVSNEIFSQNFISVARKY